MDYDVEEARLARAMIERADKAIVAADASKYNAKARARICGIDQVNVFVSDLKPPSALARKFKAAGTDVVVPGTAR